MTIMLDGKPVTVSLKNIIKSDARALREQGIIPTLALIRVGKRPDDVYYEKSIVKNCETVEIATKNIELEENISLADFLEVLKGINNDGNTHGVMIFRPLPAHLDERIIKNHVNPDKDIDCMTPANLAKVFEGENGGFVPCTPGAVLETLKFYGINLTGAKVTVVGRSLVVGKPLSIMLLKENATVTICHSKTKNIRELTTKADIVVAAIGRANMFDDSYFQEKTVVIDVGINDAGDGKMCGDVDFAKVNGKVRAITPVPGGIGLVTTAILLKHLIIACKNQQKG